MGSITYRKAKNSRNFYNLLILIISFPFFIGLSFGTFIYISGFAKFGIFQKIMLLVVPFLWAITLYLFPKTLYLLLFPQLFEIVVDDKILRWGYINKKQKKLFLKDIIEIHINCGVEKDHSYIVMKDYSKVYLPLEEAYLRKEKLLKDLLMVLKKANLNIKFIVRNIAMQTGEIPFVNLY